MAIEAPEQAAVLLELAAAGKEIMATEARPEREQKPAAEKRPADEPSGSDKLIPKPELLPSEIVIAVRSNEENRRMQTINNQQDFVQVYLQQRLENAKNEPAQEQISVKSKAKAVPKAKPGKTHKAIAREPRVRKQPKMQELSTAPRPTYPRQASKTATHLPAVEIQGQNGTQNESTGSEETLEARKDTVLTAKIFTPDLETSVPSYETDTTSTNILEVDNSEEYVPTELGAVPRLDAAEDPRQLNAEIVEVYEELVAISEAHKWPAITLLEEAELAAITRPEESSQPTTSRFEAFLNSNTSKEKTPTIEVIKDKADGQELEQTLVQLAKYLAEAEETRRDNELNEVIQQIEEALSKCYIVDEKQKPQITVEMTEKLIILLRALGYQKPKEALVSFVTKHDIDFLLQALEYICELNNKDNQKEFLLATATPQTDSRDSTAKRFAELLFGLVAKLHLEPVA